MEITVKYFAGRSVTFECTSTDLIYDIKLRLQDEFGFGLPPYVQRLTYKRTPLDDWRTLGYYEIDKHPIVLDIDLRGGGNRINKDISLEGIESAIRKLQQIEAFVFLVPLLQLLLLVLGSLRRGHHNTKVQLSIRIVYVLSAFLVSNTISKMLSASFINGLFPIWAVLLLKFYGGTDSISVYSIDENGSVKTFYWILLGLLYSVISLFFKYKTFWHSVFVFLVLTGFKTWERARAQNSASNGLVKDTKVIADFMTYEDQLSIKDFATDEEESGLRTVMEKYNYLVQFEETNVEAHPTLYQKRFKNNKEVVTLGKIWQCKGEFLRTRNRILQDICLSFALFKLLCCRFAKYPLSRQAQIKLSTLVCKVLQTDNDPDNIFRVIELELVFLHDFFYTKYSTIFRKGFPIHKFVELLVSMTGCCIAAFSLRNYEPANQYLNGVTVFGYNVDKVLTGSAILVIVVIEIGQFILILCSDWAKVMLLCCYVQHSSLQRCKFVEKVLRFICNRRLLKPWGEVLGQYSLLESFDHIPNALLYNSFTSAFMEIPRKGQKESARIKLPVEVKQAVSYLVPRSPFVKVTHGLNSLPQSLIWACKLESPVHVVMVWHIATSLCEMKSSQTYQQMEREREREREREMEREMERERDLSNFIVANSLSKYCAYLVAFCPRLIPYHANSTEFIFDQVVCEARKDLEGCPSMTSRYEKMMALEPGENILTRGAKLAKQLIETVESTRWRILADFWAEMMLFVAISDDEMAHAEYLAKGGEFVTHLWALLHHAGATKQEWTSAGSSEEAIRHFHVCCDQLPHTFRLCRVQGLPAWANTSCVSIEDVIKGHIVGAILSNQEVDIDWLKRGSDFLIEQVLGLIADIIACPALSGIPVMVIHGTEDVDILERMEINKPADWILHKLDTNHSKAMILFYSRWVRIIVHTANLAHVDWHNKSQGLWMQDFPCKGPNNPTEPCEFENDLIDYLSELKWPEFTVRGVNIDPSFFKSFDYSDAMVRLIASVPGCHTDENLGKWGHMKLRTALQEYIFKKEFRNAPLVYQFSSLGSLDEEWMAELALSMSSGVAEDGGPLGMGKPRIVWPTVEDIRLSFEGYKAGKAVPSPLENVEREFLKKYWAKWNASHTGRCRAMPHIKTYARYSGQELAWLLLTSADLCKDAWGVLQEENSQLVISSYELGVLFLPPVIQSNRYICSCAKNKFGSKHNDEVWKARLVTLNWQGSRTSQSASEVIVLPVPYELPPPPYFSEDVPWSWDRSYGEEDVHGKVWPQT